MVTLKTKPSVGATVTRVGKPSSEHGVVKAVEKDTVTVCWHLKEDEKIRGRAGSPVGTVYEDPTMLIADTSCPFCTKLVRA